MLQALLYDQALASTDPAKPRADYFTALPACKLHLSSRIRQVSSHIAVSWMLWVVCRSVTRLRLDRRRIATRLKSALTALCIGSVGLVNEYCQRRSTLGLRHNWSHTASGFGKPKCWAQMSHPPTKFTFVMLVSILHFAGFLKQYRTFVIRVIALTYCSFGLSHFFIMRLFTLFLFPLFHFEFIT